MVINRIRHGLCVATLAAAVLAPPGLTWAEDGDSPSQLRRAIAFLDARQAAWSGSGASSRGAGADKTTCLSCHTGISYALTRPLIGRFVDKPDPSAPEEKTIADVTRRVEHWSELDAPRFTLMYDFDERKKVESRGTEAVLDALILARNDSRRGRSEPASVTRTALTHLWESQLTKGNDAGSWEWLNFGLEPWEGDGSRAFGAALAAIAVGSAPGYLDGTIDEQGSRGVTMLRDYLRRRFPDESLHNRLWMLEAAAGFKGLVSPEQTRELLDKLRAAQHEDGGWSLGALGKFQRVDGSAQSELSDGYATGLALHALIGAGGPADQPARTKGLAWLRSHQRADGSWPGISVNKERDPATFAGQLMTDAATAFSSRALVESGSP